MEVTATHRGEVLEALKPSRLILLLLPLGHILRHDAAVTQPCPQPGRQITHANTRIQHIHFSCRISLFNKHSSKDRCVCVYVSLMNMQPNLGSVRETKHPSPSLSSSPSLSLIGTLVLTRKPCSAIIGAGYLMGRIRNVEGPAGAHCAAQ